LLPTTWNTRSEFLLDKPNRTPEVSEIDRGPLRMELVWLSFKLCVLPFRLTHDVGIVIAEDIGLNAFAP
jgi:hypothetical protein